MFLISLAFSICKLGISRFGFEGGIRVLIAQMLITTTGYLQHFICFLDFKSFSFQNCEHLKLNMKFRELT